ncbi:hypothetical protein GCM10023189_02630 [Nibrella saemangeumensis]|uniref:Uncharacterized protein n=1 Tax=Nibrella saemangeumensis TaxID=1084526 RepID=A0ABP8M9J5_9BACT
MLKDKEERLIMSKLASICVNDRIEKLVRQNSPVKPLAPEFNGASGLTGLNFVVG